MSLRILVDRVKKKIFNKHLVLVDYKLAPDIERMQWQSSEIEAICLPPMQDKIIYGTCNRTFNNPPNMARINKLPLLVATKWKVDVEI